MSNEERQPNTETKDLCADCGKPNFGHDYLHSTHPFRKKEPNTELREKAANWPLTSHLSNLPPDDGRLWRTWDVVAFAASIQEEARVQGRTEMLEMILSSLKSYPNGGGDINTMKEVDRIISESKK